MKLTNSSIKNINANGDTGFGRIFLALVLLITAFSGLQPVLGQSSNPVPVQFFYVPIPEDQLLLALQTLQAGAGSTPSNPIQTYMSLAAISDNTIIYYDQWENGYDADISNPVNLYSAGNPGGTQIWGDGNPANGYPPGVPGDIINAGTVIILNNPVTTTSMSTIDFDGGDKIAATKTIAIVRSGWATGPNTLLAAANETYDTDNWGTSFVCPVGEDMPTSFDNRLFGYTGLCIMAGVGGANVQVDADANGSYELSFSLTEGKAYLVNGGVNTGAKIISSRPVQIDLLTGDRGEQYESRFFGLSPTNLLYSQYYTPVSTPSSAQGTSGTSTVVFLYNPNSSSMTVNYTTRTGSGGNTVSTNPISLPAGGYAKQVLPDGYGASFVSTNGEVFHALSATDADNNSTSTGGNRTWDWGYTLIGNGALTPQVLVGLGIGRDPTSTTNPNENGNPVWVTPVGNGNTAATIYVDYDADPSTGPLTDPNGNKYNTSVSLREFDRAKLYDANDNNQTGMLVYTLTNGVKLAAAWGQDPLVASASAPGLDMGTGIPPVPLYDAGKNGTLYQDNDGDGVISPGDILEYKIVINNISRAPVPDITVVDDLPADVTYIPNTTFYKNHLGTVSQIADDASGTVFPLDGSGKLVNPSSALPVAKSYEITFRVKIKNFEDLTPGLVNIVNTGHVDAVGTSINLLSHTAVFGRIGDYVWSDLNQNGIQDAGENGVAGIIVNLIDANGNIVTTDTSESNGAYHFYGVAPGSYKVSFSLPSNYLFTTKNADAQGLNGAANSDANTGNGQTDNFTLAAGERNNNVDCGMYPKSTIGDKVWNDANQDGIQDASETGISNVTVKLFDNSANLIASTTTDANGNYSFANVNPGSYYVQFISPSGKSFTVKDAAGDDSKDSDADPATGKTNVFTLTAGQSNFTIDAGLYPTPGSIGDFVWNDVNANGIQDSGENGLSNITVKLLDAGNTVIATTATDANGAYHFANLAPGSYSVEFTAPANYSFTLKDAGSDDTKDSDVDPANGKTAQFVISPGQNNTSIDAGLKANPGSIGDFIWEDVNGNGIQDAGEAGLNNVTVKLFDNNNNLIATTLTDNLGAYSFTNVPAGNYYVNVIAPLNYSYAPKDAGSDDAKDSDVDPSTGKTAVFTLNPGQSVTTIDAGLMANPGSIGDFIWNDVNGNGIQDAGEAGLNNVTVKLFDSSNNLIATTLTDSLGAYSFANVPAGNYYVQVTAPLNYSYVPKDAGSDDAKDSDVDPASGKTVVFTLNPGQSVTTIDAGLKANPGSIGDFVWNDVNGNGIQDAGEAGLGNVTVKLFDSNNNLITATLTDSLGAYSFTNVPVGSYYVQFISPSGYTLSPIDAGSDDTKDSDADPLTGRTALLTITPGLQNTTIDAGMRISATDVEVIKTASVQTISCGASFRYTILAKNTGQAAATNVKVSENLPAGLDIQTFSATQGIYNPAAGLWSIGNLPANTTATLTIDVMVNCSTLNLSNINLGPAGSFNVFALEDFMPSSADVQGKLAVGRDARLGGYSVGDQLPPSGGTVDVLVVGRNLQYTSGGIWGGNVVYGNSTNLPVSAVTIFDGTVRQGSPIDFAAAKSYLENLSTLLGNYAVNGSTTFQWGTLNMTHTNPYLNVFSVNGSDLSSAHTVQINVPNGSAVIVNVTGSNINWHGGLFVNGTAVNNVIYNFPQASDLTISGIEIRGALLAPFAALNFPAGLITGQAIIKSMTGSGQFNLSPFLGNIPANTSIINVASVQSMDQDDSNPANNSSSVSTNVLASDTGSTGGGTGSGGWQLIGNLPEGETVTCLGSDHLGNIFVGTVFGYIYKSADNGSTWTRINYNMYSGPVWSIESHANGSLLAATVTGVYVSNDGTNWTQTQLQNKDVRALKIDAAGNVYAGTWGFGMFVSTNCGIDWTESNNGLGNHMIITAVAITPNQHVFASTFDGGVFRSLDNGGSWTSTGVPYNYIWALASNSAGDLFAGTYGDGLYRSTNDGLSWTKTLCPASYVYELRIDAADNIFAASYSGGVFVSTNNGANWTNIGMGGMGLSSIMIVPSARMMFSATLGGQIFMKLTNLTDVNKEMPRPNSFSLEQNYPNPFNPSTKINYSVAKDGFVSIKIYNILGKEVCTLVNNYVTAGYYTVNFNADNLASGVYIYRIQAGKFNATRKLIIQK